MVFKVQLGITIAAWQRHSLLDAVLAHNVRILQPGDRLVVVGSERETAAITSKHGVEYVTAPNRPLGAKRNVGLQALRGEVDAVVILNSDDFLSERLFLKYKELLQDHPVVGLEGLVFLVQKLQRFYVWSKYRRKHRRRQGIGPGRVVRKDVLDEAKWTLWPAKANRGLDNAVGGVLPQIHLLPIAPGHDLVDVKSSSGITSWETTQGVAERLDPVSRQDLPFPDGTFRGVWEPPSGARTR